MFCCLNPITSPKCFDVKSMLWRISFLFSSFFFSLEETFFLVFGNYFIKFEFALGERNGLFLLLKKKELRILEKLLLTYPVLT